MILPEAGAQRDPLIRLLAAIAISLYGYTFGMVAIMVLLLQITGSPAAAAAYLVVRSVPRAIGARPGGTLADRFGPHRIAAACCLVQSAAMALVIAAGSQRHAWLIYVAVAFAGLAAGIFQPATMALTPRVVSAPRLARANTAYNGIVATAVLAPPALSVPLLALGGPNLPLAVDTAGFLVAAILMVTLKLRRQDTAATTPAGGPAVRVHAFQLFLRDGFLRSLAISAAAEGVVAGAAQGAFIAAAAERFGGDDNVGLLYAAVGVGSLVGTAVLLRLQPARVPRLAVVGAALLTVLALGLFAAATEFWLAMFTLGVAGMATSLYETWGTTQLQRDVEPEMLGRASGVVVTLNVSGVIAGALLVTVLIPLIGWAAGLTMVCAIAGVLVIGLTAPRRADIRALRQVVA
jgi:predicted MFS family arabinose efflux permease